MIRPMIQPLPEADLAPITTFQVTDVKSCPVGFHVDLASEEAE